MHAIGLCGFVIGSEDIHCINVNVGLELDRDVVSQHVICALLAHY